MQELPVIQKTYDFIRWYIPILNGLPKVHRFGLGDRMVTALYDLLDGLIRTRYARNNKLLRLEDINSHLDVIRYQTRLLHDFELISTKRYDYAGNELRGIGQELGGWIKHQRGRS